MSGGRVLGAVDVGHAVSEVGEVRVVCPVEVEHLLIAVLALLQVRSP